MKTSRREEIPFSLIVRVDFLGFRAPLGPATRSRENTRHDRLEAGWIVQGPTRRVGRSSNDRYAWLFPLFLPTLRGERATRRGDEHVLRGPRSFLPSFTNGFPMRHQKVVLPQHRDLHPRFNRFTGERLATSLWLSTRTKIAIIIIISW